MHIFFIDLYSEGRVFLIITNLINLIIYFYSKHVYRPHIHYLHFQVKRNLFIFVGKNRDLIHALSNKLKGKDTFFGP